MNRRLMSRGGLAVAACAVAVIPWMRVLPQDAATRPSGLADLSWMVGDWEGTFRGAELEEHWISAKGRTMLGLGRTVLKDRTMSFEFLRLEQRKDGIVYVASPNGGPVTEFRQTASDARSAQFENPTHDHPKVIRYALTPDGGLVATLEGDEGGKHVKQEFRFTRVRK